MCNVELFHSIVDNKNIINYLYMCCVCVFNLILVVIKIAFKIIA